MTMDMKVKLIVVLLASVIAYPGSHAQTAIDPTDLDADGFPGVRSGDSDMTSPMPLATVAGRLLVDRSHGQDFDVSGFGSYLVSQDWTIDSVYSGPITEDLLASEGCSYTWKKESSKDRSQAIKK